MIVLLVTGSFPPDRCGVGDYTARLCEHLDSSDNLDIHVLTSSSAQQSSSPSFQVHRIMDRWALRDMPAFVRVLRGLKVDLVHLQYPSQGYGHGLLPWFIPLITRLMGKKLVQTWHEPYSRRRALKLIPKAVSGGGLVVVRPDYRELLHWMLRWIVRGKRYRYIRSASTMSDCRLSRDELAGVKTRYLQGQQRLIVFFGFIFPHKGVHLLFDFCNPETDHITIAGEPKSDSYQNLLSDRASQPQWLHKVDFPGFMDEGDVSALLKVADAVVLPFQLGGGDWNTSIHAATQAGTFVLTTSLTSSGYDASQNVYFAEPDNISEMKSALDKHAGQVREVDDVDHSWSRIAQEHITLYSELLS